MQIKSEVKSKDSLRKFQTLRRVVRTNVRI